MTSDKNIETNLEYLDDILKHLVDSTPHYTLTFSELYGCIYAREFEIDNKFNAINHLISISEETDFFNISINDNQRALGEKLVEACFYLKKNGFIIISLEFNVKITFQGILKYSDGFANLHQKEKDEKSRLRSIESVQKNQGRWLILLTFLVALGTLVSAWYYLTLILCSNL